MRPRRAAARLSGTLRPTPGPGARASAYARERAPPRPRSWTRPTPSLRLAPAAGRVAPERGGLSWLRVGALALRPTRACARTPPPVLDAAYADVAARTGGWPPRAWGGRPARPRVGRSRFGPRAHDAHPAPAPAVAARPAPSASSRCPARRPARAALRAPAASPGHALLTAVRISGRRAAVRGAARRRPRVVRAAP